MSVMSIARYLPHAQHQLNVRPPMIHGYRLVRLKTPVRDAFLHKHHLLAVSFDLNKGPATRTRTAFFRWNAIHVFKCKWLHEFALHRRGQIVERALLRTFPILQPCHPWYKASSRLSREVDIRRLLIERRKGAIDFLTRPHSPVLHAATTFLFGDMKCSMVKDKDHASSSPIPMHCGESSKSWTKASKNCENKSKRLKSTKASRDQHSCANRGAAEHCISVPRHYNEEALEVVTKYLRDLIFSVVEHSQLTSAVAHNIHPFLNSENIGGNLLNKSNQFGKEKEFDRVPENGEPHITIAKQCECPKQVKQNIPKPDIAESNKSTLVVDVSQTTNSDVTVNSLPVIQRVNLKETSQSSTNMLNESSVAAEKETINENEDSINKPADLLNSVGDEFRYTCGVCQKMFTNYVNMCRHRRLAHGTVTAKTKKAKQGPKDFETASVCSSASSQNNGSSRSQSPAVVKTLTGSPAKVKAPARPQLTQQFQTVEISEKLLDPETLFYSKVASNIRENLLHHLDGKLECSDNVNKEKEPERSIAIDRPKRGEKILLKLDLVSSVALNGAPHNRMSLLAQSISSEVSKVNGRRDGLVHKVSWEKYNFPKNYDGRGDGLASYIKDMSHLDISTQLVMRQNLQRLNSEPTSPNTKDEIDNSDFDFPRGLCLMKNDVAKTESISTPSSPKPELSRTNSSPSVPSCMDVKDKSIIELDCPKSSGARRKSLSDLKVPALSSGSMQRDFPPDSALGSAVELSGEWVRPRKYICGACGERFRDLYILEDHKYSVHPNVWCTHLEFEESTIAGMSFDDKSNSQLPFPGSLCRRFLNPTGALTSAIVVPPTKASESSCTKCSKVLNSLSDLHRHMLECGGDNTWMLTMVAASPSGGRRNRKWRPFGSRRRRQQGRRGMKRNIPSSPMKLPPYRARHRATDIDSIQRMISNLPAKRATRRVIQFSEDDIKTRSQATIHSVTFAPSLPRTHHKHTIGRHRLKSSANEALKFEVKKKKSAISRVLSAASAKKHSKPLSDLPLTEPAGLVVEKSSTFSDDGLVNNISVEQTLKQVPQTEDTDTSEAASKSKEKWQSSRNVLSKKRLSVMKGKLPKTLLLDKEDKSQEHIPTKSSATNAYTSSAVSEEKPTEKIGKGRGKKVVVSTKIMRKSLVSAKLRNKKSSVIPSKTHSLEAKDLSATHNILMTIVPRRSGRTASLTRDKDSAAEDKTTVSSPVVDTELHLLPVPFQSASCAQEDEIKPISNASTSVAKESSNILETICAVPHKENHSEDKAKRDLTSDIDNSRKIKLVGPGKGKKIEIGNTNKKTKLKKKIEPEEKKIKGDEQISETNICEGCGLQFDNNSAYGRHMKTCIYVKKSENMSQPSIDATNIVSHQCNKCWEVFNLHTSLVEHSKVCTLASKESEVVKRKPGRPPKIKCIQNDDLNLLTTEEIKNPVHNNSDIKMPELQKEEPVVSVKRVGRPKKIKESSDEIPVLSPASKMETPTQTNFTNNEILSKVKNKVVKRNHTKEAPRSIIKEDTPLTELLTTVKETIFDSLDEIKTENNDVIDSQELKHTRRSKHKKYLTKTNMQSVPLIIGKKHTSKEETINVDKTTPPPSLAEDDLETTKISLESTPDLQDTSCFESLSSKDDETLSKPKPNVTKKSKVDSKDDINSNKGLSKENLFAGKVVNKMASQRTSDNDQSSPKICLYDSVKELENNTNMSDSIPKDFSKSGLHNGKHVKNVHKKGNMDLVVSDVSLHHTSNTSRKDKDVAERTALKIEEDLSSSNSWIDIDEDTLPISKLKEISVARKFGLMKVEPKLLRGRGRGRWRGRGRGRGFKKTSEVNGGTNYPNKSLTEVDIVQELSRETPSIDIELQNLDEDSSKDTALSYDEESKLSEQVLHMGDHFSLGGNRLLRARRDQGGFRKDTASRFGRRESRARSTRCNLSYEEMYTSSDVASEADKTKLQKENRVLIKCDSTEKREKARNVENSVEQSTLELTKDIVTDDPKLFCEACHESFTSSFNLAKHKLTSIHIQKENHTSGICDGVKASSNSFELDKTSDTIPLTVNEQIDLVTQELCTEQTESGLSSHVSSTIPDDIPEVENIIVQASSQQSKVFIHSQQENIIQKPAAIELPLHLPPGLDPEVEALLSLGSEIQDRSNFWTNSEQVRSYNLPETQAHSNLSTAKPQICGIQDSCPILRKGNFTTETTINHDTVASQPSNQPQVVRISAEPPSGVESVVDEPPKIFDAPDTKVIEIASKNSTEQKSYGGIDNRAGMTEPPEPVAVFSGTEHAVSILPDQPCWPDDASWQGTNIGWVPTNEVETSAEWTYGGAEWVPPETGPGAPDIQWIQQEGTQFGIDQLQPISSLGSILDSVNQILNTGAGTSGEQVLLNEYGGFSSTLAAGSVMTGELVDLQRAMGATDEEMLMLQKLGEDGWPLENADLMDLDNQRSRAEGGVKEQEEEQEGEETSSPLPAKTSPKKTNQVSSIMMRRQRTEDRPFGHCQNILSQYEQKEMVCPLCNKHFLGLAALQTHVASTHNVREGPDSRFKQKMKTYERSRKAMIASIATTTLGQVINHRHMCVWCKELHVDEESLQRHVESTHSSEGIGVKDEGLKSHMSTALGGLLNRALGHVFHTVQNTSMCWQPQCLDPMMGATGYVILKELSLSNRKQPSEEGGSSRPQTPINSVKEEVVDEAGNKSKEPLRRKSQEEDKDKPYSCHMCDVKFLVLSSRNRHIARVHGLGPKPPPEEGVLSDQSEPDFEKTWVDLYPYDWNVDASADGDMIDGSFLCLDCGINFQTPQEVLKHRQLEHNHEPSPEPKETDKCSVTKETSSNADIVGTHEDNEPTSTALPVKTLDVLSEPFFVNVQGNISECSRDTVSPGSLENNSGNKEEPLLPPLQLRTLPSSQLLTMDNHPQQLHPPRAQTPPQTTPQPLLIEKIKCPVTNDRPANKTSSRSIESTSRKLARSKMNVEELERQLCKNDAMIKAKAEAAIRELSLSRKGRSSASSNKWGVHRYKFTVPDRQPGVEGDNKLVPAPEDRYSYPLIRKVSNSRFASLTERMKKQCGKVNPCVAESSPEKEVLDITSSNTGSAAFAVYEFDEEESEPVTELSLRGNGGTSIIKGLPHQTGNERIKDKENDEEVIVDQETVLWSHENSRTLHGKGALKRLFKDGLETDRDKEVVIAKKPRKISECQVSPNKSPGSTGLREYNLDVFEDRGVKRKNTFEELTPRNIIVEKQKSERFENISQTFDAISAVPNFEKESFCSSIEKLGVTNLSASPEVNLPFISSKLSSHSNVETTKTILNKAHKKTEIGGGVVKGRHKDKGLSSDQVFDEILKNTVNDKKVKDKPKKQIKLVNLKGIEESRSKQSYAGEQTRSETSTKKFNTVLDQDLKNKKKDQKNKLAVHSNRPSHKSNNTQNLETLKKGNKRDQEMLTSQENEDIKEK
uniref:C2H2-type domain-containing protein n=1 Tax=Timema bartmani TaxID=61472 RepID=A0A7R9EQZ6_9NEOP|nr:unnamed protein product [Timema bartmani]